MTEDRPLKHRSRCRIFADILQAIQDGGQARVTFITHEANLPYERLIIYLDQLDGLGLIVRNDVNGGISYALTEKGHAYLAEFRKIKKFGDIFGVEV
jgi:predicted transcriptional regulator